MAELADAADATGCHKRSQKADVFVLGISRSFTPDWGERPVHRADWQFLAVNKIVLAVRSCYAEIEKVHNERQENLSDM